MGKKRGRNERKAGIDASTEKRGRGKEKSAGANGISNMFFLPPFFFASLPLLSSPPHTRILIFRNSSRDGRTSARSAPAIRAARRGEEKEEARGGKKRRANHPRPRRRPP